MSSYRIVLAASVLTLAACGDDGQNQNTNPNVFIAQQSDFADYKTWPKYTVATGVPSTDEHGSDNHVAYINKLPPTGSTEFPTGTIIVKEAQTPEGALASTRIHAMVKRSGGFNANGAKGWEWFEVTPSTKGVPVVLWRGALPPDGSGYGDVGSSNPAGDCNTCHSVAATNDYVQGNELKLSAF